MAQWCHMINLPIHCGPVMPYDKFANSLWPSDAIWHQWSWSSLVQVMAYCLTARSQYQNLCWLIISKVQWHSSEGNFIRDTSAGVYYTKFFGRLYEEPFPWLIQKFPCILIFKTGQPGCQLNLSEGQIRLDLRSARPLSVEPCSGVNH